MRRGAGLLTLEPGKAAYQADLVLYGMAVLGLAAVLLIAGPPAHRLQLSLLALCGLLGWSVLEYLLHRFVMHGLQPFQRWHQLHHERPNALIFTPTVVSGTLIMGLVFLPALLWQGPWVACSLTVGVLAGYLAYGVTHHATHHWRGRSAWLKQRKRWHARHHHAGQGACYGVTSSLWDQVFRSTASARRRVMAPSPPHDVTNRSTVTPSP